MSGRDTMRCSLRPPAPSTRARWLVVVAAWGACLLGSAGVAVAQNMDISVAGIQLGPQVSGPPLAPQAFARQVVVLDFWGVHCPPCIASMPKLEELHRSFSGKGLVVVGAHAQGGPPAEIKKTVDALGVTFPIVENANVAGGMDFRGIPHCMVFDHTGKCVFRGSPGEAHNAVVEALKAAPPPLLEGRQLVKLASLATTLKDESVIPTVFRKMKELTTSKDEELADEARFVIGKLEAHARQSLDRAIAAKSSDPVAAANLLQRSAVDFKGTDVGTEAKKLIREWKKDKAFTDAVKSAQQCAVLESMREKILKTLGVAEIAGPDVLARVPTAVRKQVRELAGSVQELYPGSTYAEKAGKIAREFGAEATATP